MNDRVSAAVMGGPLSHTASHRDLVAGGQFAGIQPVLDGADEPFGLAL
jgi:hypothetical protein